MAKRLKAEDDTPGHTPLTPEEFKKLMADMSARRRVASERSGEHGALVKNACDRYGLEKNALTFTRRMFDMEDGKRQGILRSMISYWNTMGWFRQVDAFDDVIGIMREIVKQHDEIAAKKAEADKKAKEQKAADKAEAPKQAAHEAPAAVQ